ncbi:double-strand break repair helicase AddA [Fulvimarina sp. 2208YS6-2-32]|uniref:DNA 3'-5' helicase n=1 Tax=Fulvimarina uroteuthidis TaxID=3098149 RepID=A0ABU5HYY1_9HYPH|nr:double-strand break repair helicase AddA [Fulvimarina sp. 2208YS6-2-32]MDY8108328.1 double-strand break repair helicase AddA [Fulvimarina sp. 2208YS6-2-32]
MSAFAVSDHTTQQQRIAADPNLSVFVSANAGAGKTHVLTERVVRLLLAGFDPSRILCLTFTKAAAAEMSNRVFKRLSAWATMPEADLLAQIEALEKTRPAPERIAQARQLFARALETPGGLKIQTIHAFCEAILHQFPLEANVAGHFEVLDDTESQLMLGEVKRRLITGAAALSAGREAAQDLRDAFAEALAIGGEFGFDGLLGEIVQKRDDIRRHIDGCGGLGGAVAFLAEALDIDPDEDDASIVAALGPVPGFDRSFCEVLQHVAGLSDKKTDVRLAGLLPALKDAAGPLDALHVLRQIVMTQAGGRRSVASVATKAVTGEVPDLEDRLDRAQTFVEAAEDRLAALKLFRASRAALVIADALERDYAVMKRRRGRLDFTDLIARTADLLSRSQAASWVHYKLDQGIDHILIDEAQDTSPRQWEVMRQLVDEFFVGRSSHNRTRTVFAVGDEKQSIYSFQGASPKKFDEERRAVEERAQSAGLVFRKVSLNQSFRTLQTVLGAVDTVFADPQNREGLSTSGEAPAHTSARKDGEGLVEIWPTFRADSAPEPDDWRAPMDEEPTSSPAYRLSLRIALQIKEWLGDPVVEKGEMRPLHAGDVMILVRKRTNFIPAMAAALRDADIAVAGTDRITITEHIAVQDLVALGRVATNYEDDLSLAALLKSPLFEFDDDELMALALSRGPGEHLSGGLRRLAGPEGPGRIPDVFPDGARARDLLRKAKVAIDRLDELRNRTGFQSVFAFYARILGPEGGRARLMARLGRDTGDVVDAFLDLALSEEAAGVSGLDAFLSALEQSPPEVKRQMDAGAGEVRIMTTHASKGLEAPVVFLVDPGAAPFHGSHGSRLMRWDTMPGLVDGQAPGLLWRASSKVETSAIAALREAEKRHAEEEYRRLLYVGMTRAAERLVICGTAGTRGPDENAWRERVETALKSEASEIVDASGNLCGWRIGSRRTGEAGSLRPASEELPLRTLDLSKLDDEPLPPRPLTPSSAGAAFDADAADEASAPPPGEAVGEPDEAGLSPVLGTSAARTLGIRRGLLVHRLLQHLPTIAPEGRREIARAYAERALPGVGEEDREALLRSVHTVMEDARFAPLFSPTSRAEVAIAGTVRIGATDFAVNGTIDRLAVGAHEVLIVDYKTNRPPPRTLETVPREYIRQLAIYRALVAPLFPDRPVRAALLFTEGPHILSLDDAMMDAALRILENNSGSGKPGDMGSA